MSDRREAGFTLIELMLSVIILVVGLLGLASAMASMTRHQDLTASRTEMGLFAEAKLEQLRLTGLARNADTLQLVVGGSLTASQANHADTVAGRGGRRYIRRWTVVTGFSGTRLVTLRVLPQTDDRRTPARLDFTTQILQ
jgi:prepilin-type N-terminal cleavage/methylation domain-containing protein